MDNVTIPAWYDRFAEKVNVTDTCWIWTSTLNNSGYGFFGIDGHMRLAHRLSYELAYGAILPSQQLDHQCRNRTCVNPAHLKVTTQKQNMENQGVRAGSKSGIRGVTWLPRRSQWLGQVGHNGKVIFCGTYERIEDAAQAVLDKRLELFTNNVDDRVVVGASVR